MLIMQRDTPIGHERLVSYLLHKKPGCVQTTLIESSNGSKAWQVTLTDATYKNSPLVCPVTFHSDDYTEAEVLHHATTESWLKRVTGYQRTVSWSV